jgi:hypothetical protein
MLSAKFLIDYTENANLESDRCTKRSDKKAAPKAWFG